MTVSPAQIIAAQARGLINVVPLAAACNKWGCPFWVACLILDKETDGRNIYGHDVGGIFTYPDGRNVEVTEANYTEFLRRLGAGERSNGCGPMQLTYRGYHIGPLSMQATGYKAWLPADNMLYGVKILATSWKAKRAAGLSVKDALWAVAKGYNGGSSYADDAVAKMPGWLAAVGDTDTKPEVDVSGLEISSKMHPNARHVTEEVLDRFQAIEQIWTHADFPDHNNDRCTDYMVTIVGMPRTKQVELGDLIAAYLIKNADRIGLNWLIWNRRIYRHQNTDRGHGWADYTGPKPHTDHVHMEVDDRTYQPPEDDMPTAKEIVDELIKRGPQIGAAIAKGYLNADDIIPSGRDEPSATNKFQTPKTFVKSDHDLLVDIREALEKLAEPPKT